MDIRRNDIEVYLKEVKCAVEQNRYRIELNPNRKDNLNLFFNYVIDEEDVKDILLDITVIDFSEVRKNSKKGYEHEKLYIFGKDVELLEKIGNGYKKVSLYIKLNKLERNYVIVISIHEQKYPLRYHFK